MNLDKESHIGHTLQVDVDYLVNLQPFIRDLTFVPEKRVMNGVTKLVDTFYNRNIVYVELDY